MHKRIAAIIALVASVGALAQEITLFQSPNFSGPNFSANSSVPNLANVGFNDRASSIQIRAGTWQLCADDFFRGQCVTLQPGNYNNLGAMGLNNAVSSLREVGWSGGGGGGGGGIGGGGVGGGGGNSTSGIVLYQWIELAGRSIALTGNVNNLDELRFNDRASSAVVSRGTWQICSDANFGGSCGTFPPGRYDNLGPLTGQASSVRIIGSGGGQGGGQGGGWGGGGPGGSRVMMYEGPNFSGRSFIVNNDILTNFSGSGFNDRAASLRIEQGYWMFCTDANFGGQCRTLGPGDYATLPSGLSNSISSARKISNDYPYNRPPNW